MSHAPSFDNLIPKEKESPLANPVQKLLGTLGKGRQEWTSETGHDSERAGE